MACKIICDGCGKEENGEYANHSWHKPHQWYERKDEDGPQTACSRQCIDLIAKKTGKTDLVCPV